MLFRKCTTHRACFRIYCNFLKTNRFVLMQSGKIHRICNKPKACAGSSLAILNLFSTKSTGTVPHLAPAQRSYLRASTHLCFYLHSPSQVWLGSFDKSMEMARVSCSFAFNGLNKNSSFLFPPSAHSRSNALTAHRGCCEFTSHHSNNFYKIKSGGFSLMSKRLLSELKFARRLRPVSSCPADLIGLLSRTHIRRPFCFRLLRQSMTQASKVWWI